MLNDFLSIHDLSLYEFNYLLDLAGRIKKTPQKFQDRLNKKTVALVLRDIPWQTRVSFETAILQLGGRIFHLDQAEITPDKNTPPALLGKILESWLDAVVIGASPFTFISSLAQGSAIPIINAQSDFNDPCTAMSDFFTLRELRKNLADVKLAYAGKNLALCHSLLFAAAKAGCQMTIAAPSGQEPEGEIVRKANEEGNKTGFHLQFCTDPLDTVQGASVIYTDSESLLAEADPEAVGFYCPPAGKAENITPEKFAAPDSTFFNQIENRLHIQKAIMVLLLEDKK